MRRKLVLGLTVLLSASCGGGTPTPTFSVGGTISGLSSGEVVLQNNGENSLTVSTNGRFTFTTRLQAGSTYQVTVSSAPAGYTCTVSNGSGTIGRVNAADVSVVCSNPSATTYTIGGTISGLSGTLVLQNNAGDNLSISADGTFTFATALQDGATYLVTVLSAPDALICTASSNSGTIQTQNVTGIAITCVSSRESRSLSVAVGGAGSGTVTSADSQVNCTKANGSCTTSYNEDSEVVLTAAPDTGYVFSGWSGDGCSGGGTCTLTLSANKSVRATFVMIVFETNQTPAGVPIVSPGRLNLWLVKTDGSGSRALTQITNDAMTAPFAGEAQWSPDGETILFTSTVALDGNWDADQISSTNIWTINPSDGSDLTPLTSCSSGGGSNQAMWSPDGTRIVFASTMEPGDPTNCFFTQNNIWVMNSDGSGLMNLTDLLETYGNAMEPQWSPDGSQVVFVSDMSDPPGPIASSYYNIWVANADGSGSPTQLTNNSSNNFVIFSMPKWSPDGTQILFESNLALSGDPDDALAVQNIWVMSNTGSNLTHLTNAALGGPNNSSPQWSPDGTRIVFVSEGALANPTAVGSGANIWIADADGDNATYLTGRTDNLDADWPQWSADGTSVVFEYDNASGSNIMTTTVNDLILNEVTDFSNIDCDLPGWK